MSDAAARENRSDERRDLQTKIFKIAIAACAATVLGAGYALDSTRHFLNGTIGSEGSEGHCHVWTCAR